MRKARYLKSAERNLLEIYQYIAAESGDFDLAVNTAMDLRGQCRHVGPPKLRTGTGTPRLPISELHDLLPLPA